MRLPIDPGWGVDPLSLAGPGGYFFRRGARVRAGRGTALSIPLADGLTSLEATERVASRLASIPCDDRVVRVQGQSSVGTGVVAFGSFPFDRTASGMVVVPAVIVGSDGDGSGWITLVGDDLPPLPPEPKEQRAWLDSCIPGLGRTPVPPRAEGGVPATPLIEPRSSDQAFEGMVASALGEIRRGGLEKVVLARQVDVIMDRPVAIPVLLGRWMDLEPDCGFFSVPAGAGQFVGASPELLVERTGVVVRTRPLAGTSGRRTGPEGSGYGALLQSSKDGNEHRLVVEAIAAALAPFCSALDVPDGPDLVQLHNLAHLGTVLSGTLATRDDGSVPTALDLVAVLHPTPAVAGVPTPAAEELIARVEPEPRGHYAGPVGFVDASGDGTWMVGIRAISVEGASVRLAAGVGIVDGSDPTSEREEADLKLTAVFDALAPGFAFSTVGPAAGRRAVS